MNRVQIRQNETEGTMEVGGSGPTILQYTRKNPITGILSVKELFELLYNNNIVRCVITNGMETVLMAFSSDRIKPW